MNLREVADPDCPLCHGRGAVKGEGMQLQACPCVALRQHQRSAKIMLDRRLPLRARAMTFENFDTGQLAQNNRALQAAQNYVDNFPQAASAGWVSWFPRSAASWGKRIWQRRRYRQ